MKPCEHCGVAQVDNPHTLCATCLQMLNDEELRKLIFREIETVGTQRIRLSLDLNGLFGIIAAAKVGITHPNFAASAAKVQEMLDRLRAGLAAAPAMSECSRRGLTLPPRPPAKPRRSDVSAN